MAVIAHADDAEFTCGGTPGLWVWQGAEIAYVVCSYGSKGWGDRSLSPEQLAAVGKDEQRAAADLLGVKKVDITSTFERKLAAVDCHQSQVDDQPDIAEPSPGG